MSIHTRPAVPPHQLLACCKKQILDAQFKGALFSDQTTVVVALIKGLLPWSAFISRQLLVFAQAMFTSSNLIAFSPYHPCEA